MVSLTQEKLEQMILDGTYKVDQPDVSGRLLLTQAVFQNRCDLVKILLEHGAEVDHPSTYDQPMFPQHTPLFLAVANKNLEIAKILLDAGASVDQLSSKRTPLFLAVQMGYLQMMELLLRHHANPHAVCCLKDGYFESPIHFALKYGRIEERSLLLEAELFNLVSIFNFCHTEEVSIHQHTVKWAEHYLKMFASTASEENPLGKMRMEMEEEPIINKKIKTYNWTPEKKAEVPIWALPDWI